MRPSHRWRIGNTIGTVRVACSMASPLAARAQQPERVRRIGVLVGFAADDPDSPARIGAFTQALQQLGWTDGRNVRIDTRWGGQYLGARLGVPGAADVPPLATLIAQPAPP